MTKICRATLALSGFLFTFSALVPTASAQSASLSGAVTDSSGAAAAGAQITVLNEATGTKTSTTANERGLYVIPFLNPGVYDLSVALTGFQPSLKKAIKLDVDQSAHVDFTLQVGTVNETVEVSGAPPALQTDTASLGQVVENKMIVNLPLNGRDYTQLVTLSAGAAPNHYSRAGNGFSLNGGATLQTTLLLDGIDNSNYEIGTDSHNMNALTPSVDALQEFRVETANYSAEYGRSANGIVSATIKSGGNGFHGDAFEFLRNNVLDANDFFANRAGLARAPLRRNQFGGTLGGPVIRNRSFFFASYQGTRLTSSQTVATTVPLPGQAGGAFGTKTIYDPLHVAGGLRQPFPGNVIPSSRIDPVGAKLAALYPAPNLPGAFNNYAANQATANRGDELDSRFDEQLTSKDSSFFRYSRGVGETRQGGVFAPPGNGGGGFGSYPIDVPVWAWSLAAGETHIFSPSLVNEFHAGYTHNSSNQTPLATTPLFNQFGFAGIPPSTQINGLPTITLTGYSALGDRTFTPNLKLVQLAQVNDTASWVHGKHTLRFGVEFVDTHDYADSANLPRGSFSFTGQFTSQTAGKGAGPALADLLLGQTAAASLGTFQAARLRNHYYGAFVNDSWNITPSLTINFGLRYDLQTPWWERDNRETNFDFTPGSANYGTLVPAQAGGYFARTFVNADTANFAPRLGVAWRLGSKTVVRSGFGVFYGDLGYMGNNDTGTANPPYLFNVAINSPTTASVSSLILANGFPAGTLDPAHTKNPNVFSISGNYPMPLVDQWNLSVQRDLGAGNVLTVAYVGSSSSHLPGLNDINAPPPGPGAINPRRPFPNYGEIEYETPYGHSTYNALQATFERRFSKGLSMLATYTYSHSLDDVLNHEDNVGGSFPQNPLDWAAEKASSGFDVPHRFVDSLIYQLPMGKSGGFLGGNRVARLIAGGWGVGGIFVAQGGFPLTLTVSPNPANTTTPARPDRLCNGNVSGSQRSIGAWFDVACFARAAPFTYGNSGRGVIRAPGLVNLDFLAQRNFYFTEARYVEFRAELFNFGNSAHYGTPDTVIGTPQAGQITSTSTPNREVEFGLRMWF